MTWALKRQIFFIIILILFFSAVGFLIVSSSLNKAPSCVDGKQNGAETGIDCGGSCLNACLAQVDPVSILWARAFRVVPGRYNAVAYLENHNKNNAVNKINYRFRFADENNVYLGKREGTTFVPPSGKFAVFEPGVDIGNSIPIYTTFEFTEVPKWIQVAPAKTTKKEILVSSITLTNEATSPRLSAILKNSSFSAIRNLDVIAILYDVNHNAVSASRTYMEVLAGEESKEIVFTWPEPLSNPIIVKEIIPMYDFWSN